MYEFEAFLSHIKNGHLTTLDVRQLKQPKDLSQGTLQASWEGHTEFVWGLIQLADSRLASGSGDKTVKLWDLEKGQCVKTFIGHTGRVRSLIQLTDGRLASASEDKTVKLWDVEKGQCVKTFTGHTDTVWSLIQLADGRLASGSGDNTVKLWDVEKGQCVKTLTGHTDVVRSLVQLTDGRLASASVDKTLKLWDLEKGQCVKTLTGHTDTVCSLIQLADGRLASASVDKTVKLWDVEKGQCVKTFTGHTEWVSSLLQLTDDRLASGSGDKTVKLWNAPSPALTDTQFKQLLDAFNQNPHAHTIVLTDATLTLAHYIQLCEVVAQHPGLTTLDLRGCRGPWQTEKGKQLVAALQARAQAVTVWVDADAPLVPDLKYGQIKPVASLHYTGFIAVVAKADLPTTSSTHAVKYRYQIKSVPSLIEEFTSLGFENAEAAALELRTAFKKQSWQTPTSAQITALQFLFQKYPLPMAIGLFTKIMQTPALLDSHVLTAMFEQVTGLALFRLPYTLASIGHQLGVFDPAELNALVYQGLQHLAEKHIVDTACITFYKLLIRDAFHKGLITRPQRLALDNIAENTKTFSDPRFKSLQEQVQTMQHAIRINTRQIAALTEAVSAQQQSIQLIAQDLSGLKRALQNQARRQLVFGVAKMALGFVGAGLLADLATNTAFLADLSDMAGMGATLLGISPEKASALLKQGVEYFQEEGHRKQLITSVAEKSLKMVGLDPEQFVMVWAETSLALTQPMRAQETEGVLHTPGPGPIEAPTRPSLAMLYASQSTLFANRFPVPALTAEQASTRGAEFPTWLNEVQAQGRFTLTLTNKEVIIQFQSHSSQLAETDTVLVTLNTYLKQLPEMQPIKIKERYIEDNCLLITAETKLNAKLLATALIDHYGLEASTPVSRLTLVN